MAISSAFDGKQNQVINGFTKYRNLLCIAHYWIPLVIKLKHCKLHFFKDVFRSMTHIWKIHAALASYVPCAATSGSW